MRFCGGGVEEGIKDSSIIWNDQDFCCVGKKPKKGLRQWEEKESHVGRDGNTLVFDKFSIPSKRCSQHDSNPRLAWPLLLSRSYVPDTASHTRLGVYPVAHGSVRSSAALFLRAERTTFFPMYPPPFHFQTLYAPLYGKVVWIIFPPFPQKEAYDTFNHAMSAGGVDHPDGLLGKLLGVYGIRAQVIAITDAEKGKALYVPPRRRYVAWVLEGAYIQLKQSGLGEGLSERVVLYTHPQVAVAAARESPRSAKAGNLCARLVARSV